ncbi:GNAT family N-acetyltransferase [Puerhibacterium puerhi]|uniref:GNAT family N-acetyltransferase n=1 Tax=Puerhibacterium puerhi TaxID=2692623 RepID=UPI001915AEF4|nr:GNAT family N-acetyltransferase [Puerhibacterium puerhi]
MTSLSGGAVLRPAAPGDEPGILECIRGLAECEREPDAVATTTDDLTRALFGPRPAVFAHVVEQDGEVAGIAVWFLSFSTWTGTHGIWLEDFFVRPEHRGRGYGVALLRELAHLCVERGYERLEWTVLDWNAPSIALYEAVGGRPQDEWTTYRLAGDALGDLAAGRRQK